MVELVGKSGEVVPDLFTHRDGDLLALARLSGRCPGEKDEGEEGQLHGEAGLGLE